MIYARIENGGDEMGYRMTFYSESCNIFGSTNFRESSSIGKTMANKYSHWIDEQYKKIKKHLALSVDERMTRDEFREEHIYFTKNRNAFFCFLAENGFIPTSENFFYKPE